MMRWRQLPRSLVLAAALTACYAAPAYAYDPFTDAAQIKPEDELEERLWDEAEVMRSQFVRGRPSPAVETMQRLVRGVVMKTWPELTRKVRVYVIDQADVMAFTSANGDIYISTGMLMRLDSEKELQVILAREIAHFTHRHTARTVYASRLGAGAKVIASTALDAADFATKITTGLSAMDMAKSLASLSQELLLTSGKEILEERLNRLRNMMADAFFRSMSVTGIGMVVKSSVFGFKDSLEEEADDYAMAFIERKHGSTEAYRRVMQRLYDEAVLDEKKFSLFYANENRLADRLKALKEFEDSREERLSKQPLEPIVEPEEEPEVELASESAPEVVATTASGVAPAQASVEPANAGPAASALTVATVVQAATSEVTPSSAEAASSAVEVLAKAAEVAVTGADQAVAQAANVAAVTSVEVAAASVVPVVASVAAADLPASTAAANQETIAPAQAASAATPEQGTEAVQTVSSADVAVPAPTEVTAAMPEVVAVAKAPSATIKQTSYGAALQPLVMPLLESELEAGRYGRLSLNIERKRDRITLPDRARMVLAESYVSMSAPAMQERGLDLAKKVLEKSPDNARMLRLLGNVALRKGQLPEAKNYLTQALANVSEADERGFIEQTLRQIEKKLTEAPK